MYTSAAILTLEGRIGWGEPVQPTTIVISLNNKVSASGLYVNDFHKLATVEKVHGTVENPRVTNEGFAAELDKLRRGAVVKVLKAIFDLNTLANRVDGRYGTIIDLSATDYTQTIIDRANVFDNAIGYQLAFDVLQMQATTTRSNMKEREVAQAYDRLQIELEGANSAEATINTKGIERRLREAIQQAIDILFPQPKRGLRNYTWAW